MKRGRSSPWLAYAVVAGCIVLALGIAAQRVGWHNLWLTPDQQGRLRMERGKPDEAAALFRAPIWRGVAQFRAGDFKAAAQTFAGVNTAEGAYDQGNALVMLGKYEEAGRRYDRALALRPGWADAEANRKLAAVRAERVKAEGGEETDDDEKADAVVYDKTKQGGQETPDVGPQMSDESIRASWLKRVQTRPADFLRTKFAYQLQAAQGVSADGTAGAMP